MACDSCRGEADYHVRWAEGGQDHKSDLCRGCYVARVGAAVRDGSVDPNTIRFHRPGWAGGDG